MRSPISLSLRVLLSTLLAAQSALVSASVPAPRPDPRAFLPASLQSEFRIRWDPAAGPYWTIVLEDVHLQGEAASLIADAVRRVDASGSLSFIGVEGTVGPVRLDRYRRVARGRLPAIAWTLFSENQIGPVVYDGLAAPTGLKAPIEGLENAALYAANVGAYRAGEKARKAGEGWNVRSLARLQAGAPSRALLLFAADRRAFGAGRLSLGEYVERLARTAAGVSVPPSAARVLDALRLERRLDARAIAREKSELLRFLSSRRVGVVTEGSSIPDDQAAAALRAAGPVASRWPALTDFARYRAAIAGLDDEAVAKAVAMWEGAAVGAVAAGRPDALAWLEADRFAFLTARLLSFGLSPDGWTEWQTLRARGSRWFVDHRCAMPPTACAEAFYRAAEKRSRAFAERLPRAGNAIVVVGGFHADDVRRSECSRGRSVLTLTPRLRHAASATAYLTAFDSDHAPAAWLVPPRRLFLGLPEGLGVRRQPVRTFRDGAEDRFDELAGPEDGRLGSASRFFQRLGGARGIAGLLAEESLLLPAIAGMMAVHALSPASLPAAAVSAMSVAVGFLSAEGVRPLFLSWHRWVEREAWDVFGMSPERYRALQSRRFSQFAAITLVVVEAIATGFGVGGMSGAAIAGVAGAALGAGALWHATRNLFSPVPSLSAAGVAIGRQRRLDNVTVAVNVMDAGAFFDGLRIRYRNSLVRIERFILPILARWGVGWIYLYGGVHSLDPLSRLIHTRPDDSFHLVVDDDRRVFVGVAGYRGHAERRGNLILDDGHGNAFSVLDPRRFNALLSAADVNRDLARLMGRAHADGLRVMTDFIAWAGPSSINESNYRSTFYREMSDMPLTVAEKALWAAFEADPAKTPAKEDAVFSSMLVNHGDYFIVKIREDGVERPVFIRHMTTFLYGFDSFGIPHKDQVILNIFDPQVQAHYRQTLRHLIDAGFDGIRIDLGFMMLREVMRKFMTPAQWAAYEAQHPAEEPLRELLHEAKLYARSKGREFHVTVESYEPRNRDYLLSWDSGDETTGFVPTIDDVYDNGVYERVKRKAPNGELRDQVESQAYAFRPRRKVYLSNFDEPEKLVDLPYATAALLGSFLRISQRGVRFMVDWLDLIGHHGPLLPIVGPCHPFAAALEVALRLRFSPDALLHRSPFRFVLDRMPRVGPPEAAPVFLDTSAQHRYFASATRAPSGVWAVSVADLDPDEKHGKEPLWIELPAGFLDGAGLAALDGPARVARLAADYEIEDAETGVRTSLSPNGRVWIDAADSQKIRVNLDGLPASHWALFRLVPKSGILQGARPVVNVGAVKHWATALAEAICVAAALCGVPPFALIGTAVGAAVDAPGWTADRAADSAGWGAMRDRSELRPVTAVPVLTLDVLELSEANGPAVMDRVRRAAQADSGYAAIVVTPNESVARRWRAIMPAGQGAVVVRRSHDLADVIAAAFAPGAGLGERAAGFGLETLVRLKAESPSWSTSPVVRLPEREVDVDALRVQVEWRDRIIALTPGAIEGSLVTLFGSLNRLLRSAA